jgi:hypothetical protein
VTNSNLAKAKKAKNYEFYTQFPDIEKEMNAYLEYDENVFQDKIVLLPCDDPEWSNFTKYFAQNFERFGLKKLVSVSYAPDSKPESIPLKRSLLEEQDPRFDPVKSRANGKLFTLQKKQGDLSRVDINALEWDYMEGTGDFLSDEVRELRDEADIVVGSPPFALFREFSEWLMESENDFIMVGNMNAITYKEVFDLIKENRMWLGATANSSDMVFAVPPGSEIKDADKAKAARMGYRGNYTRLGNARWFTSLEHGRRHEPLPLMTEADNIKYSRHKQIKGVGYRQYDNYDAIEVPFIEAIPSDYEGVMGVPISFLSKHNPEQFEILGMDHDANQDGPLSSLVRLGWKGKTDRAYLSGKRLYSRIFIRKVT